MKTLLIVTVGGSCTPIVAAIQDFSPDYTCFIASAGPRGSRNAVDGPGDPCGDSRTFTCPQCGAESPMGNVHGESIVVQAGLGENEYEILELQEPDSLHKSYSAIRQRLAELVQRRPDWRRIADYTGGTKTMSVALALAAMEASWELSLVKGARTNLIKVLDGTEMAGIVNTAEVRAQRDIDSAMDLFNGFEYGGASELLESIVRRGPVSSNRQAIIRERVAICRAFDAWDKFNHPRARNLLEPFQSQVVPHWRALKILTARSQGTGYELVLDLINNAHRKAARRMYDDAVARLYRALELLAQVRLSELIPDLQTGDVKLELLPENLRRKYGARRRPGAPLRLGLLDDYELLRDLDDPVGEIFEGVRNRTLDVLKKRNLSIMAHGLEPLQEKDFEQAVSLVQGLIQEVLKALNLKVEIPQFPKFDGVSFVLRKP